MKEYLVRIDRMSQFITRYQWPLLLLLLFLIMPESSFADEALNRHTGNPDFQPGIIKCAVANLFKLIEGAFGALIMVVAGIGAIIAASMGAYRAAVGMLVVAVGSFILRALVSIFFGAEFDDCSL